MVNNENKQSARRAAQGWPWFELYLSSHELKGRSQVRLSKHVLHLRAEAPQGLEPKPITGRKRTVSANLLHLRATSASLSLEQALGRLHAPDSEGFSLLSIAEVLAWAFDRLWLPVVKLYLDLQLLAKPLAREVQHDAMTYLGICSRVVVAPHSFLPAFAHKKDLVHGFVRRSPSQHHLVLDHHPLARAANLALFVVLAVVLAILMKGLSGMAVLAQKAMTAREVATHGVESMGQASEQLLLGRTDLARANFQRAQQAFSEALATLDVLPVQVRSLAARLNKNAAQVVVAEQLLRASGSIAEAGELAAQTWTLLAEDTGGQNNLGMQLETLTAAVEQITPKLEQAQQELLGVALAYVPAELTSHVANLQTDLATTLGVLKNIKTLPDFLKQVLVTSQPKRYVVMFQNSTELRPTGGFMGSLAILEVQNGTVQKVDIPGGGPYDFQGSLKRTIYPPDPLRLVRGTWQLQDSNWFFDFPSSARKVLWFLSESGLASADGVIALSSDIVPKLLTLTGPIELPAYRKIITSDNFYTETQSAVELEYDRRTNRPKQFIADLAPVLLQRLLELPPTELLQLTSFIDEALAHKTLQVYLSERSLQEQVVKYGWGGEVRQAAQDYLAIVRTNIGGGKSDASIREEVVHTVKVDAQGKVTNELTVTLTHAGTPGDVFTGRRNTTYLRFYVPAGAQLLSAYGFTPPNSSYLLPVPAKAERDADLMTIEREISLDATTGMRITEEFGKSVFGNWISVAPGESKSVTLHYKLPFQLTPSAPGELAHYSIVYQKQAGVSNINLQTRIYLPSGSLVRWVDASGRIVREDHGLSVNFTQDTDDYVGLLYSSES